MTYLLREFEIFNLSPFSMHLKRFEAYSGPSPTSKTELLVKKVDNLKPLTTFTKISVSAGGLNIDLEIQTVGYP